MHLTIIHTESLFFAGAQKMLGYFIETAAKRWEVTLAMVPTPRLERLIPPAVRVVHLPSNQEFSPKGLLSQLHVLMREVESPPQIVHGWAARDWELTALMGRFWGKASVGSLHDHPQAPFISSARQRLMWGTSVIGLDRVICVSEAVRQACLRAGYDAARLAVIRNGLPLEKRISPKHPGRLIKLGFIGAFSERKGLRELFVMVDRLAGLSDIPWELHLAGGVQDFASQGMMDEICGQYQHLAWWPQVKWLGWVENPQTFFDSIDVLICPSADFDPFPTVLLEAGQAGIPALATRVGGIPEIIVDGVTGWVVDVGQWESAARILATALSGGTAGLNQMGQAARLRMESRFTVKGMADDYARLYEQL